ncbi:MAG: nucleotidyltransferase [Chitinophagaceae bacterium]|nr:nucleotidyltransferase [Chitinophagaceae bacterium]
MDVLDEELLKFWQALNNYGVQYIMVGGFAVNMHGYSRATNDIDVWIKDDKINRKNFGKALEQFGYGDSSWEELQFVPGWTDFYIGPGIRLDVLTTMKGIEDITFEQAFEQATIAKIEKIPVPFLHINQLIQNKKAVNRPKDQIDVLELEKIKQLRKEMGLDQ